MPELTTIPAPSQPQQDKVAALQPNNQQRSDAQAGHKEDEEVIVVPEGFTTTPGVHLTNDLITKKMVASGVQGEVWTLQNAQGDDAAAVLKVMRYPALGWLKGDLQEFQREWMIGRRLNSIMDRDSALRAFMKTGPLLVTEKNRTTKGSILEKMTGYTIAKRMTKDETFHDIEYIIEMLLQVFTAMDKANRLLGYKHRDLRCENVMEHRQDVEYEANEKDARHRRGLGHKLGGLLKWRKHSASANVDKAAKSKTVAPFARVLATGEMVFKIIDYGHSEINDRLSANYAMAKGLDTEQSAADGSGTAASSAQHTYKLSTEPLPDLHPFSFGYKLLFWGRSDAWRLLRSLCVLMDGRVWPASKKYEVEAVSELIYEVAGVRPHSFLTAAPALNAPTLESAPSGEPSEHKHAAAKGMHRAAAVDPSGAPRPSQDELSWPKRRCTNMRKLRDILILVRGYCLPPKPRVTASEALLMLQAKLGEAREKAMKAD